MTMVLNMTIKIANNYLTGLNRQDVIPTEISRKKTLSVCVALALVAGASLATFDDVEAAESKKKSTKTKTYKINQVDLLQEENARLRAQLEKLQSAQSVQPGTATSTATGNELTANPSEPTSAESTETLAKAEANKTDNLGEVTVRGRNKPKIAELKDVTRSSSVVGGDELKSTQSTDLSSILKRTGNATWVPGNSRTFSLTMRGIGYVPLTDQMDNSVGTTIDGVPYSYAPMASFDQYDVESVQVDRGPQGTAGGKNYNIGTININNKQASFTNEASGSVTYGKYNAVIADGAIGGKVIDGLLAYRAAIHVNKMDGYIGNVYNPGQSWYNKDRENGRLSLLLTPSDNFKATLAIDAQPNSSEFYNGSTFFKPTPATYGNGAAYNYQNTPQAKLSRSWFANLNPSWTPTGSYFNGGGVNEVNQNSQYPLVASTKGINAKLNWDLGNYKLSSITAARSYDFQASNDEGTPFNILQNGGGYIHAFSHVSQELKLESKIGKLVDYQTGLYFLERKMNLGNMVGYGSDAGAYYASGSSGTLGTPGYTPGQYNILNATVQGQKLMSDSLNGLQTSNPNFIDNKTGAWFGEAKWNITDPFSIITGVRVSAENRADPTQKLISAQGAGANLNPGLVNNVNTGGFNSTSIGALGTNTAAQLAIANSVSQQYFGVADYNNLTADQKLQVANAKSLRASQIGVLWNPTAGQTFAQVQPTFNFTPTFKFNDQWTAFTSYRFAQKAGFSQTVNGVDSQIKPETSNNFEIGFKSNLLNNDLHLNADFFFSQIFNYQQGVSVLDSYTTNLNRKSNPTAPNVYIAAAGNAPGVRTLGIELDGSYQAFKYSSIRFAGAFTDARYTDFKTSANPLELGNQGAYRDVSGQTLAGAAQFTFNVGPEVHFPAALVGLNIPGNQELHANLNTAFTSSYNSDPLLSSYGMIRANSTTDFSVGIGRRDKGFDVSLVGKNVFANYANSSTLWNSYVPYTNPQWFGFTVSGKF